MLVDDLLAGLPMDHTLEAMRLIRSLAAEDGLAVLMACSDGEPAMRAHHIWRLEEGGLTLDDEPEHDERTVVNLSQRRRNGR